MVDFIIIGAGTAGCVLANRLSENPNHEVLLLEAGKPDKKQEIHIPAAFSKLFKTEYDWEYYTEPERDMNNRKMYWPRGKTLGGCSSINAMIYIRGNKKDFDRWAELGNEGWSFEEVLPYFKKSENQTWGESEYHGVGGPMNIENLRDPSPLSKAFIYACLANGIPANPDFNGDHQEGAGFYQTNMKRGARQSSAGAFIKPVLDRPNLTVETEAQVLRILFEGKQVIGIEYRHQGEVKQVSVRQEVILSAGAINSPQLLMVSGVGPREHLAEHGIETVMDLPGVGQNMQDHLAIAVTYHCKQPITLAAAEKPLQILNYLVRRRGMLSSNVGEAGAFVRSHPEVPLPDIQFHFAPTFFLGHGFNNPEGHGYTIGPVLVQPKSVGEIRLRSGDPADFPVIRPNYVSHPDDMAALVAALKLARKIGESKAFDPYRAGEHLPGTAVVDDEGLREHVRNNGETLYHPVGTCKMGGDNMAVVNAELKVHGVQGLRVVDASIMPDIIGGNTNAPVVMIAEKAADMIKETAKGRQPALELVA